jgi:hypothetical protein
MAERRLHGSEPFASNMVTMTHMDRINAHVRRMKVSNHVEPDGRVLLPVGRVDVSVCIGRSRAGVFEI